MLVAAQTMASMTVTVASEGAVLIARRGRADGRCIDSCDSEAIMMVVGRVGR